MSVSPPLVVTLLALSAMAGCTSTMSNSALYQSWERQAYQAYYLATPRHTIPVARNPVIVMNTPKVIPKEQEYIARHYGI